MKYFPEEKDYSSSLYVQTSSEVHPASCPMGTGGPFPGVSLGGGVTLTIHPHLVPRPRMSRSNIPLPLGGCMAIARHLYFFFAIQFRISYFPPPVSEHLKYRHIKHNFNVFLYACETLSLALRNLYNRLWSFRIRSLREYVDLTRGNNSDHLSDCPLTRASLYTHLIR
jgi:hypothetical protein